MLVSHRNPYSCVLISRLRLSGDDHDYCKYSHVMRDVDVPFHPPIKEITVKSFSMAMGIVRPGFQMLSLDPESRTHASIPCNLPSVIHTLLLIYAPLVVISVLVLLASIATRKRTGSAALPRYRKMVGKRKHSSRSSYSMTSRGSDGDDDPRCQCGNQGDSDSGRESPPPLSTRRRTAGPGRGYASYLPRACCCWRRSRRRRGLCAALARDVVSVAGWPICVWFVQAFWTFYVG